MRVYLPATLPLLRQWLAAGEADPAGVLGSVGYAVTPSLREWYLDADVAELEHAAQVAASVASLELLARDGAAERRRVVIAAELADADVAPASARGRAVVALSGPVSVSRWACALIDDVQASAAVVVAVASLPAAALGDDDARFDLDEVESHELGWHAVQELRHLFGRGPWCFRAGRRGGRMEQMDAFTAVPPPVNEPVRHYAPGSAERASLEVKLKELGSAAPLEFRATIAGERVAGEGEAVPVVQPHRHCAVLGHLWNSTPAQVAAAVDAAIAAAGAWRALSFDDRAAVFLKAADLLSGPWRDEVNASTMLGQSKTCYQAEIDAACELADFWRFNVHFASQIYTEQPESAPGVWNRFDHRPLEGFVLAITPFNFTSIAANLPTAPALMGVPVVWKPSPTQSFSADVLMRLLGAAGLPPGVINLVTGDGRAVSEVALVHPDLAGVHFTGSTPTFQQLWRTVAENLTGYRSYPRLVGETGGKDFVIAHPSADVDALRIGLIRGAFEYQGQKCSAASRAYIPQSVWRRLRDDLAAETAALPMGDPNDFTRFMGAVIDRRAFDRLSGVLDRARGDETLSVVAGGTCDDSEGFFVSPSILLGSDPTHEVFTTEFFGPILSVHVYDDADYATVMRQAASASPYALTGAIFAQDRGAVAEASDVLRYSAGNFYINDKPTGAVVGQQPFGGARASGTNDKAGSAHNLLRWTSPRVIKETFVPATDWRYPHLG